MADLPTVHRLRMLQDVLADILSRPLICSHCGKELDEEWLSDPGSSFLNQVQVTPAYRDPVREATGQTYAPGTRPVQTRSTRSRYRPPE